MQILIVDDQPHARRSLRALLVARFGSAQVREAADGGEAIRLVEQSKPDLVLMDALMPNVDGVQATRLIKAARPEIKVVMLSMYSEFRAAAFSAGADAFVSKGEPPEVLLKILAEAVGAAARPPGDPCRRERGDSRG